MFEDPQNRAKIKNIFKNISDLEKELIPKFRKAIKTSGPIALYIATKDQDDITWLFDRKEIALMLGGTDSLENITEELLPTPQDKKEGVVFAVLKKVGPIYAIKIEKAVLEEVFFRN